MSLYSNIQALGNRMVSNLQAMGVSASFNDGGLTLADKILQIQHQTKGIVVTSDKSIEQKGTTQNPNYVQLTALIMDDNGHMVADDSTVIFEGTDATSYEFDEEELVWQAFPIACPTWQLVSSTTDTIIYLGYSGSNYFTFYKTSTGWNISYKDNATPTSVTWDKVIHVGNGLLTDGNGHYVDLATISGSSSSIVSNWRADYGLGYIGKATIDCWVNVLTENGVATHYLTCEGKGLRQVRAFCGTLVSGTYPVWDTLYYDTGILNDPSTVDCWKLNNAEISRQSDGTLCSKTSTSSFSYLNLAEDNVYVDVTTEFIAEFEILSNTGNNFFAIGSQRIYLNNGTGVYKVYIHKESQSFTVDGVSKDLTSVTLNNTANPQFVIYSGGANSFKFKNFRLYNI